MVRMPFRSIYILFLYNQVKPASSKHLHEKNMAAFSYLIYRLFGIPLSQEDFKSELYDINYNAKSNGYSPNIQKKLMKRIIVTSS